MSALLFVVVAAAGGVGAAARFLVDGASRSYFRATVGAGTAVVNVSGSLLLGFVTGLLITRLLPPELHAVIGSGFLGGYTTFSTASYETVRLLLDGRRAAALASSLGMLLGCCIAATLGLWAASLF